MDSDARHSVRPIIATGSEMEVGQCKMVSSEDKVEGGEVESDEADKGKDQAEGEAMASDEEFVQAPIARTPKAPTQKQLDEHYPLHLKFEEWCPDCVRGAGRIRQHRQAKEGVELINSYTEGKRFGDFAQAKLEPKWRQMIMRMM